MARLVAAAALRCCCGLLLARPRIAQVGASEQSLLFQGAKLKGRSPAPCHGEHSSRPKGTVHSPLRGSSAAEGGREELQKQKSRIAGVVCRRSSRRLDGQIDASCGSQMPVLLLRRGFAKELKRGAANRTFLARALRFVRRWPAGGRGATKKYSATFWPLSSFTLVVTVTVCVAASALCALGAHSARGARRTRCASVRRHTASAVSLALLFRRPTPKKQCSNSLPRTHSKLCVACVRHDPHTHNVLTLQSKTKQIRIVVVVVL